VRSPPVSQSSLPPQRPFLHWNEVTTIIISGVTSFESTSVKLFLSSSMAAWLGDGAVQQFAMVVQQQLPSVLNDGGVQLALTLQHEVPYGARVQFAAAVAVLCGAWLRLVVSKAAPSMWSMLLVVPLVVSSSGSLTCLFVQSSRFAEL
jgi:hypothetical protein